MIIPVRCMNCGKLLADKYDYYQRRLREESKGATGPTYFEGKSIPKTLEAKVCEELSLTRYCCRKTFLTHVDLIDKI